jgi:tetratricopeptide (TPR) repeat protein
LETLDCANAAEGDIAYYNVIAIRLKKKETKDLDSLLNLCEGYYTGTNDKSLLSEIYMEKALHLFRNKDIYDSAAVLLNEAEQIAFDAKDYYMLTQIFWLKCAFDDYERNKIKVKEDVNLQMFYAEKTKNQRQIAYATLNKAIVYKNLNMKDSAKILLHAALLSSKYINSSDHAHIYNALGELTIDKDSILAKDYFQKSLEIEPNIPAKLHLAKIFLDEGNIPRAEELCHEGLNYEWPETKIGFWQILYECQKRQNDPTASNILENIISEKDSVIKILTINNQNLTSKIVSTPAKPETKKWPILLAVVLTAMSLEAVIILLKNKRQLYETEISRCKEQITSLKKELATEKETKNVLIQSGEKLYKQILNNQKIALWSTDDMVNFVEYYRTLNPKLVESFDIDYKKLTPRYKIILILEDLGKSIEDIKQIMSFEETSYYSARSRINGQRIMQGA